MRKVVKNTTLRKFLLKLNNMQIINVLEIVNGIPSQIESFPIWEEQLSQDVIKEAEELFVEMIKYHTPDILEEDIDYCLEEGSYDNGNGKEVYLIWSN